MVTRQQLDNDPDFYTKDRNSYYYGNWDYEYYVLTQELYSINDGFGEPEFLGKITDFTELKKVLEIMP